MSSDRIREAFLKEQLRSGLELVEQSDLVKIVPIPATTGSLPDRYIAQLACQSLVRNGQKVVESTGFHVGIWFSTDYLREADPSKVLTWLFPHNVWHPNIAPPFICTGHIAPGTGLVELVYRIHELITYHNFAPHEGLNPEACAWARNNMDRFPTDCRPLKRRAERSKPV